MFRRVAISASLNVFPHLFSASLFSCFLAELTATTVSTVSSLPLLSGNKVCFCYTRFLFLLLLFLNAPILTCRHISPPPLWSLPICPQDRPQPQSPSRLLSHSSPGIGGVRKRISRTGASRYLLLTWLNPPRSLCSEYWTPGWRWACGPWWWGCRWTCSASTSS